MDIPTNTWYAIWNDEHIPICCIFSRQNRPKKPGSTLKHVLSKGLALDNS